jgi:hypothetical protein
MIAASPCESVCQSLLDAWLICNVDQRNLISSLATACRKRALTLRKGSLHENPAVETAHLPAVPATKPAEIDLQAAPCCEPACRSCGRSTCRAAATNFSERGTGPFVLRGA